MLRKDRTVIEIRDGETCGLAQAELMRRLDSLFPVEDAPGSWNLSLADGRDGQGHILVLTLDRMHGESPDQSADWSGVSRRQALALATIYTWCWANREPVEWRALPRRDGRSGRDRGTLFGLEIALDSLGLSNEHLSTRSRFRRQLEIFEEALEGLGARLEVTGDSLAVRKLPRGSSVDIDRLYDTIVRTLGEPLSDAARQMGGVELKADWLVILGHTDKTLNRPVRVWRCLRIASDDEADAMTDPVDCVRELARRLEEPLKRALSLGLSPCLALVPSADRPGGADLCLVWRANDTGEVPRDLDLRELVGAALTAHESFSELRTNDRLKRFFSGEGADHAR